MSGTTRFHHRLSRNVETAKRHIFRAVPAGALRSPSQKAFLDAVRASDYYRRFRADGRRTLDIIINTLAFRADWSTMTVRPTWALLMEATGRRRALIAQRLHELHDEGFLGRVAPGRSSSATLRAGSYRPRQSFDADAAVYLLCVPAPETATVDEEIAAAADQDVDWTPTGQELRSNPTTRACAGNETPDRAATPPGSTKEAPCGCFPADLRPGRTGIHWPGNATIGTDELATRRLFGDASLLMAQELQHRIPALGNASTRAIRHVIRDFAKAGWTVNALIHAIEHLPDGSRWHHDGATGIAHVAAWLEKKRLAAWRWPTGAVMDPPTPGIGYRDALEQARKRARCERRLRDELTRSTHSASPRNDPQLRAAMNAAREAGRAAAARRRQQGSRPPAA